MLFLLEHGRYNTTGYYYPTVKTQETIPYSEWKQTQLERKQHLLNYCSHHLHSTTVHQIAQNMHDSFDILNSWSRSLLVQNHFNVINCNIPKVASTSVKILMANLTGHMPSHMGSDINYHLWSTLNKDGTLYDLGNFSVSTIVNMVTWYTSFIIVRHPIHRLISAFQDKLQTTGGYPELSEISIQIQRFHGRQTVNYSSVTFDEFVRWLVLKRNKNNNQHFQSFHNTCFPCAINYTYIGKFETLEEDIHYIKEAIYKDKAKNTFLAHKNITKANVTLLNYVSLLTPTELQLLNHYVKDDMEAFGYEPIPLTYAHNNQQRSGVLYRS